MIPTYDNYSSDSDYVPRATEDDVDINPAFQSGGSSTYAQDTYAYLTRSQLSDYQERIQPVELDLLRTLQTTDDLDRQLSAININADRSFGAAKKSADLSRRKYGINLGGQRAKSHENEMGANKALAIAGAKNNSRARIYEENLNAIGGSSFTKNAIGVQ